MAVAAKPGIPPRPVDPARLAAGRILHDVLEEGAYANLSSIRLLDRTDLNALDRRFASALIYGTLSRIITIDWLLDKLSRRPLSELEPWLRTFLRLGVWQLRWSRSIPPSAAINETVSLIRKMSNPGAAGYANAVLRQLLREPIPLPEGNPAVMYSLPPELFGYLRKWYGPAEAVELAESFLREDIPVTARVNCLRRSRNQAALDLQAAGVDCEAGRYCPEALLLDLHGQPVRSLAAWQQGSLTIQDEAAMLAGHAADPSSGQTIIDLCAAPGGKTCHLAEKTADQCRILAFDSHPERLRLVEENASRLCLASITCQVGDATGKGMDPALAASADLVLADVPCSGLGLLARKPEIRLTMNHEKIIGLYPLQAAILDYAATLVRPGGALIYSTCTINPAENIERVRGFLAGHSGSYALEELSSRLPKALLEHPDLAETAAAGWIQILPDRHGLDGFFIARIRRN